MSAYHKAIPKPVKRQLAVKFGRKCSQNVLEFNRDDRPYLSEASLQILLASLFRQATNVDLVGLKAREPAAARKTEQQA